MRHFVSFLSHLSCMLLVLVSQAAFSCMGCNAFCKDDCKEQEPGFYMTIGGGYATGRLSTGNISSYPVLYNFTSIGPALFSFTNLNWNNRSNTGFIADFALGYQTGSSWRTDAEFVYEKLTRKIVGEYAWKQRYAGTNALYAQQLHNPITGASVPFHIYSGLINIYHDFSNAFWVSPFVGFGIGGANLTSPRTRENAILTINDPALQLVETAPVYQISPSFSAVAFAAQLKAGFVYEVDEVVSILFQYRLLAFSALHSSNSYIISDPGTSVQNLFTFAGSRVKHLCTQAIEFSMKFDFG